MNMRNKKVEADDRRSRLQDIFSRNDRTALRTLLDDEGAVSDNNICDCFELSNPEFFNYFIHLFKIDLEGSLYLLNRMQTSRPHKTEEHIAKLKIVASHCLEEAGENSQKLTKLLKTLPYIRPGTRSLAYIFRPLWEHVIEEMPKIEGFDPIRPLIRLLVSNNLAPTLMVFGTPEDHLTPPTRYRVQAFKRFPFLLQDNELMNAFYHFSGFYAEPSKETKALVEAIDQGEDITKHVMERYNIPDTHRMIFRKFQSPGEALWIPLEVVKRIPLMPVEVKDYIPPSNDTERFKCFLWVEEQCTEEVRTTIAEFRDQTEQKLTFAEEQQAFHESMYPHILVNTGKHTKSKWVTDKLHLFDAKVVHHATDSLTEGILMPVVARKMAKANCLYIAGEEVTIVDDEVFDYNSISLEFRVELQRKVFPKASIYQLMDFADRYGMHGTHIFSGLRGEAHKDATWPALTDTFATSKGLKVVPLKSTKALLAEGKQMEHCVGAYAKGCKYQSSYILSIRDDNDQPLSTVEIELTNEEQKTAIPYRAKPKNKEAGMVGEAIDQENDSKTESTSTCEEHGSVVYCDENGNEIPIEDTRHNDAGLNDDEVEEFEPDPTHYLKVAQHFGKKNADPSKETEEALQEFLDGVKDGKVHIDVWELERTKKQALKRYGRLSQADRMQELLGFDFTDLEKCKACYQVYRPVLPKALRKHETLDTFLEATGLGQVILEVVSTKEEYEARSQSPEGFVAREVARINALAEMGSGPHLPGG